MSSTLRNSYAAFFVKDVTKSMCGMSLLKGMMCFTCTALTALLVLLSICARGFTAVATEALLLYLFVSLRKILLLLRDENLELKGELNDVQQEKCSLLESNKRLRRVRTQLQRKVGKIETYKKYIAKLSGTVESNSSCDICFQPYTYKTPTQGSISNQNRFANASNETPVNENDRRPVIMPGSCGRTICLVCAEKYRDSKIRSLDLDENESNVPCMFCREEYHCYNHEYVVNKNMISLLEETAQIRGPTH